MKRVVLLMTLALLGALGANSQIHTLRTAGYARAVDANGRLIHAGDSVTIRGVVQSVNIPSNLNRAYFFSVYDNSTDSSITVYMSPNQGGFGKGAYSFSYVPTIGDSIEVSGGIRGFRVQNGFAVDSTGFMVLQPDRVNGKDTIPVLGTGKKTLAPIILNSLSERYESGIVELDSFVFTTPSQWVAPGFGQTFATIDINNVNNTSIKYQLRVAGNIISANPTLKNGVFKIRGLEFQYDKSSPYTTGYMLMPRDMGDIIFMYGPTIPIHKISDVNHTASNGYPDSVGKTVRVKGVVQSPNLFTRISFGFTTFATGTLFSIADNSGSILVYDSSSQHGYTPTVGDSFFVQGRIKQRWVPGTGFGGNVNSGWTVIAPDSINLPSKSTGNSVASPLNITSFSEANESKIVKFSNVKLKYPWQWDTTGVVYFGNYYKKYFFYVDLVDNSGNNVGRARIGRMDSFFFMKKPGYNFDIIGIQGQDTLKTNKYSIWPRTTHDIIPIMNYYTIKSVKTNNAAGVNTSVGTSGYFTGLVYSETLYKGGTLFNMMDSTGAISVFSAVKWGYVPTRGDSIRVYGTVAQQNANNLNGVSVITPDSFQFINSGNKLVSTGVVGALLESQESKVVKLKHVKLVDASQWVPAGRGFTVTLEDTANGKNYDMYVSSATSAFSLPAPGYWFDVTGVVYQNATSATTLTDGYYIEPRDSYDFAMYGVVRTDVEKNVQGGMDVLIYPNPTNNYLNINIIGNESNVIVKVYSMTGKLLLNDKMNLSSRLNTAILPSGIYLLQLTDASGSQTSRRFIKE